MVVAVGQHAMSGMVNRDTGLTFLPLFFFFLISFTLLFESSEALTRLTLTFRLFSNPTGLLIVVTSLCVIVSFVANHVIVMLPRKRTEACFIVRAP